MVEKHLVDIYMDRVELEKDLSKALSRYIGYTTGAYDLERILSTLRVFENSPSAYINELVEEARNFTGEVEHRYKQTRSPDNKYLEEIVNFAEAMSIIETVSTKNARLRRLAPTEQGRALLGARASGNDDFFRHFLTKTVLIADADALFPVISYFIKPCRTSLQDYYLDFQSLLRERRAAWLKDIFPERVLLERIVSNIPWLSLPQHGQIGLQHDVLSKNTARHHTTPRKGWLQSLGLLEAKSQSLTELGHATYSGLLSNCEYFWLGPCHTTQIEMGIPQNKQMSGPFEDTFGLITNSTSPSDTEVEHLLDDTAEIMRGGYEAAKLVHAAQATLLLPIEYIKYRNYLDKRSYDWVGIVSLLFSKYRGEFHRLTARKGNIGFFNWIGGA